MSTLLFIPLLWQTFLKFNDLKGPVNAKHQWPKLQPTASDYITFGYVSLHYGCVIYQNPPLLPRVSLWWTDLHIVCHAQPVTKKRMNEKMLLRLEPQWIIG